MWLAKDRNPLESTTSTCFLPAPSLPLRVALMFNAYQWLLTYLLKDYQDSRADCGLVFMWRVSQQLPVHMQHDARHPHIPHVPTR